MPKVHGEQASKASITYVTTLLDVIDSLTAKRDTSSLTYRFFKRFDTLLSLSITT